MAIPKPVIDLCTPTCVVMERFYGRKLSDVVVDNASRRAALLGFASPKAMREAMMQERTAWQGRLFRARLGLRFLWNTARGHVADAARWLRGKGG